MSEIQRLAEHYRDKGDSRAGYLYKSLIKTAEKEVARSPHESGHISLNKQKLKLAHLVADLAVSESRSPNARPNVRATAAQQKKQQRKQNKEVAKLLKKSLRIKNEVPKHVLDVKLKKRADKLEATVLGNLGTVHYAQGDMKRAEKMLTWAVKLNTVGVKADSPEEKRNARKNPRVPRYNRPRAELAEQQQVLAQVLQRKVSSTYISLNMKYSSIWLSVLYCAALHDIRGNSKRRMNAVRTRLHRSSASSRICAMGCSR